MPRLRQVPRAEAQADIVITMYDQLFGSDRDPVADPGTEAGTPGDWWTVFALVPDVLKHAVRGFALYRSPKRLLDPVLRELGQTRAGWLRGSQFVYSQHCKSLRALGVSEERIERDPVVGGLGALQPAGAGRAVLHRQPGHRRRPGRRRHVRGAQGAPERRADPRAHLHHLPLRHARGDEPGTPYRVRRPRRPDRRSRGTGGLRPRSTSGRPPAWPRTDDRHRSRTFARAARRPDRSRAGGGGP